MQSECGAQGVTKDLMGILGAHIDPEKKAQETADRLDEACKKRWEEYYEERERRAHEARKRAENSQS